jgi:16S rRNA (guanine966-N2)-methyltransferase
VEHDRRTAALIRDNVQALGFSGVDVVVSSVTRALAHSPRAPYDIVFLDPPYPLPVEDVEAALSGLREQQWLTPGALVVVERSSRGPALTWPHGYIADRSKRYGETVLWYGHAAPDASEE